MGNTCAPDNRDDGLLEIDPANMDQARPSAKFEKIINSYQVEYEKMKREVEELRNQEAEEKRNVQSMQNDEIMEEVMSLKALLESKERETVQHQLEVALHSKVASMIKPIYVTKKLKAGHIEKFGRAGKSKAKPKWVELNYHSGEATERRVTKAHLMLTYSDSKSSQLVNRCKVLGLSDEGEEKAEEGTCLSVIVMMSGAERKFILTCKNDLERDSWVQAFKDGFKEVDLDLHKHKTANDYTVIEVEFRKAKLGIRVEEKETELGFGAWPTERSKAENKTEEEVQTPTPRSPKTPRTPRTPVRGGKPCDLEVTEVKDKSLFASGLDVNYIVSAINGQNLRGMAYFKQVEHLNSTKRPFTLTFVKKTVEHVAYAEMLSKLVEPGDNEIKSAFYNLVNGSEFAKELDESEDKAATIAKLLDDSERLTCVLQKTRVH